MTGAAEKPDLVWLFFGLTGRIARQSYIFGEIFLLVCIFFVTWQIALAEDNEALLALWGIAFISVGTVLLWCAIALTVKRLHDIGLPGILAVCLLIPVIQWLALAFLMVKPGDPRSNDYGPPPFGSPPLR